MSGDAGCHARHSRTGLVSNQDRRAFDTKRSLSSVSTCAAETCIAKAQKYVAGNTNETATYQPDEVGA